MQLSFGNMTMELNIFNIVKQPHNADDEIVDVDLIEALVGDTFLSNLSDDYLQTCLTHFGFDFDIDKSVEEVNALLDSAQSMDTNKWKSRVTTSTIRKETHPIIRITTETRAQTIAQHFGICIFGKRKYFAGNHLIIPQ